MIKKIAASFIKNFNHILAWSITLSFLFFAYILPVSNETGWEEISHFLFLFFGYGFLTIFSTLVSILYLCDNFTGKNSFTLILSCSPAIISFIDNIISGFL